MKTINYAFRFGPFSYSETINSAFPSSSSNIFTGSSQNPPTQKAEDIKGPSAYRHLGAHNVSSAGDKCCEEQKKNRRKLRPMGLAWRSSHPSGEVRGTRCNTHQGELRFQERNSCCAGGAVNEGGISSGLRRRDNNNVIRALYTCSQ